MEYIQSKNKSKPSKGWKDLSPNRSERKKMLEKCGEKCFLIPEKLKFPICSKKMDCKLNCEGIDSASARSGQYDYENVLKKAKSLYKRHCHPLSTRKSTTRKSTRKSTRKVKKSNRKSTNRKSTRKVKKSIRKSSRKSVRKVLRRVR
jgi:hypothetical protein